MILYNTEKKNSSSNNDRHTISYHFLSIYSLLDTVPGTPGGLSFMSETLPGRGPHPHFSALPQVTELVLMTPMPSANHSRSGARWGPL